MTVDSEAADVFGVMVASAEAAAADGETISAPTQPASESAGPASADASDRDSNASDAAATLLNGVDFSLIQPQAAPAARPDAIVEASAGPPQAPVEGDATLPTAAFHTSLAKAVADSGRAAATPIDTSQPASPAPAPPVLSDAEAAALDLAAAKAANTLAASAPRVSPATATVPEQAQPLVIPPVGKPAAGKGTGPSQSSAAISDLFAPVAEAAAPLRASTSAAAVKAPSAAVATDAPAEAGSLQGAAASAAPPTAGATPTGAAAANANAPAPTLEMSPASAALDPAPANAAAPAPAAAGASAETVAAVVTQSLSSLSRATIETTAQIAAQITRRLEGRSTRFEMKLAPEGLGNVDVSLDIGADGQLAARLAFDNPLAATELRGRADELRRQLEDAGFTIARDALDFAERDPSSAGGDGFDRRQNSRAFANASRLAAQAEAAIPPPAAWVSLSLTPRGVDMKV